MKVSWWRFVWDALVFLFFLVTVPTGLVVLISTALGTGGCR